MRFSEHNILYGLKQLVTGSNADDTPVAGGLLPGTSSAVNSSAKSADGGIKVDKPVPLPDVVPATTAFVNSTAATATYTIAALTGTYATDYPNLNKYLSAIANYLIAVQSGNGTTQVNSIPVITVAETATAIGTFSLAVPRDYDEATDRFTIYVEAAVANSADNATTVTASAEIQHIATPTAQTAVAAVTGVTPFTTTTLDLTTTPQVVEIVLSGNGLKRNDIIAVTLALGGTATANGAAYVYSVDYSYDSTIVSYNDTDATDNPSTSGLTSTANIQPGFGNPLR